VSIVNQSRPVIRLSAIATRVVAWVAKLIADGYVGSTVRQIHRVFRSCWPTGAQPLFRFVAAAYERRSLGIASHWPFESWGRFLPENTTAVGMLDRLLHHCHTVVTDGDSCQMKHARANGGTRLKTC
jgi:hypothetical protein